MGDFLLRCASATFIRYCCAVQTDACSQMTTTFGDAIYLDFLAMGSSENAVHAADFDGSDFESKACLYNKKYLMPSILNQNCYGTFSEFQ